MDATTDTPKAPTWDEIQEALLNPDAPVASRYRALFHTKSTAPSSETGTDLLLKALKVQRKSVLLRHELAYVLGQLGDPRAAGQLREIFRDSSEDDIVRHEAVEALAALEDKDITSELEQLEASSSSLALRHTCELAIAGLKRKLAGEQYCECSCQYTSKDPAQGKKDATEADLPAAAALLANVERGLYDRYEAMFTLRNVGGEAAAKVLAQALRKDTSSEVLRHEVAFVLGQMESEEAVAALIDSLADVKELGMVRHEAAIALGAVGTDEAVGSLKLFATDADLLVAESCVVALETAAYWKAWEELEARVAADNEN